MRFALDGAAEGRELRFVDQRMFGGLSVSAGGAELPPEIAHIARDPLDPEFDDDAFVAKVRRRSSGIKRQLLDQNLVSGVGNIYADEALWRARLHGERAGEKLTAAQVRELLGHARDVMNEALGQGGTSFDALYVNVNGESGYFDRSLHAYGREGEPCDRCGAPMRRVAFMNRSSYFCPVCQPVPRRRRDGGPEGSGRRLTGGPSSGTLEDGPWTQPQQNQSPRIPEGSTSMAKALIGYMNSDLRDPRLAAENSRLRARVGELEALVLRLSEENDKLVAARAEELLVDTAPRMQEMQPA